MVGTFFPILSFPFPFPYGERLRAGTQATPRPPWPQLQPGPASGEPTQCPGRCVTLLNELLTREGRGAKRSGAEGARSRWVGAWVGGAGGREEGWRGGGGWRKGALLGGVGRRAGGSGAWEGPLEQGSLGKCGSGLGLARGPGRSRRLGLGDNVEFKWQ